MRVVIWHNESARFDRGYEGGDALRGVFDYESGHREDRDALDAAFNVFNAPPEFLSPRQFELATRYRAKQLRSLSVGDVVEVAGRAYSCERLDWRRVDIGDRTFATPLD